MKAILQLLVLLLATAGNGHSQPPATGQGGDLEIINSIFNRIEVQGVSTDQKLLYGYYFVDGDKDRLESLKNKLLAQAYRFAGLTRNTKNLYLLHVEKVEQHTRQSLLSREQQLRQLAAQSGGSAFDGFDVGNADPAKPLVTDEGFNRFMATQKGNRLFELGLALYNLQLPARAEAVFRACLAQNIKRDTAAYKLGNILVDQNKVAEGISYLLQATKDNPRYFKAFFNLGATCYDNGLYQQSLGYYQQADALQPNNSQVQYGMAAAQYALQQYQASQAHCARALQLNPNNSNARLLMQMLLNRKR